MKRTSKALLGKMLSSVSDVNDGIYDDIDSLKHGQFTALHARIEAINSADCNKLAKSINMMNRWFVDVSSLSMQIVSTYLPAIVNYDEGETKSTRGLMDGKIY